jgi:hypothetical protein
MKKKVSWLDKPLNEDSATLAIAVTLCVVVGLIVLMLKLAE